jgi:hypothetical protein
MTANLPPVRILPMNRKQEFPQYKNVSELQDSFFLTELPRRPSGEYYFHHSGLSTPPGTIVLFQVDGTIIASAVLYKHERFKSPDEEGYEGCLYFETDTIATFDPVDESKVKKIWPNVRRFTQVKWKLDPKGYSLFEKLRKHIRTAK